MNKYKRLTLNHANLHRPVHLILGTVAGYHVNEKLQCTSVYTTAGIFPAKETPEQIDQLIDQLTKGENNE